MLQCLVFPYLNLPTMSHGSRLATPWGSFVPIDSFIINSLLKKPFKNLFRKHEANYSGELYTVKSRLSKRRLSETTGLFEDDGQSRLFSLLSIAIKLPIIRISIIRKIQFFEVIRRSRLKKLLLNYPSRFEVQKSRMVIMISLFGRVRFTHLSDLANKVATAN